MGGYKFTGYLTCINSLNSYYSFNMDLLKKKVNSKLFFEGIPIFTKTKDESPTHYTDKSNVKNSIILQNTVVGQNAILSRVIADKGSDIKAGESYIGSETWPVVMKNNKQI